MITMTWENIALQTKRSADSFEDPRETNLFIHLQHFRWLIFREPTRTFSYCFQRGNNQLAVGGAPPAALFIYFQKQLVR